MNSSKIIKSLVSLAVTAVVSVFTLYANPNAVDFSALPKDLDFQNSLNGFLDAYNTLSSYHKSYPEDKLTETEAFYDKVKNTDDSNYEVCLLKLIVMRCLYNADELKFTEVEDYYSGINDRYSEEPEHHWIYGNFLLSTGATTEADSQYNKYIELTGGYINGMFLQDLAYFYSISGRRLLAMNVVYQFADYLGQSNSAESLGIYNFISSAIKESSSDQEYDKNVVWYMNDTPGKNNWLHLDSTMLGISVAIDQNWDRVMWTPFTKDKPAIVFAQPDSFDTANGKVGLSVVMEAFPESLFEKQTTDPELSLIKDSQCISTETKTYRNVEWTVKTLKNDSLYTEKGGGRFIYLEAVVSPSQMSGVHCEHIIDWNKIKAASQTDSNGQMQYYVLGDTYRRLNEDMHIYILIDSCNAIQKETDDFVETFMNEMTYFE